MTEPFITRAASGDFSRWSDEMRGHLTFFKMISSDIRPSDSISAGIAELAPQGGILKPHHHAQSEIYFVLDGEGIVTLGEEERPVVAGDAVFIPGGLRHGIRNDGEALLRIFYVLAAGNQEDVHYHFAED